MIAVKDDTTAQGMLKIGSMESTVVAYLSEFLAGFHEKNPQVTVQVESGTTESILQKVLEHRLNGAFVSGPIRHPELFTKQVRTEKLCLIASKSLVPNKDIQAALAQPLLVFPHGCAYRKILEHCVEQYSQRNTLTVLDVPEQYALVPTVFVYRKDSFLSGAMCSFINAI